MLFCVIFIIRSCSFKLDTVKNFYQVSLGLRTRSLLVNFILGRGQQRQTLHRLDKSALLCSKEIILIHGESLDAAMADCGRWPFEEGHDLLIFICLMMQRGLTVIYSDFIRIQGSFVFTKFSLCVEDETYQLRFCIRGEVKEFSTSLAASCRASSGPVSWHLGLLVHQTDRSVVVGGVFAWTSRKGAQVITLGTQAHCIIIVSLAKKKGPPQLILQLWWGVTSLLIITSLIHYLRKCGSGFSRSN